MLEHGIGQHYKTGIEQMRNKYVQVISIGLVAFLLSPLVAVADESEDIIKYRRAVMKAIGGHMSATSLIVRGKISNKAQLRDHADGLKKLSADIPALFPEDSDFGETRAKAEVWDKPEAFKKAADEAITSIDKFLAAVDSGKQDAIAASFKGVGDGCKGCHKDFRQKDE